MLFRKLKESTRLGRKSWYCFSPSKSNSRLQLYYSRRKAGTRWYEHSGRHCVQDKYLGSLWCNTNIEPADGGKKVKLENIFGGCLEQLITGVVCTPRYALSATCLVQAWCWAVQGAGWETLGLTWPQGTSAYCCAYYLLLCLPLKKSRQIMHLYLFWRN